MFYFLSVQAAKLTTNLLKTFKLGKGSALPGRVALAINPNILKDFANKLNRTNSESFQFFTTGTNGKTTSTGILKQICIKALERKQTNFFVICNDMGANLYYGICSELANSTDMFAQLKSHNYSLELDEAAFVKVAGIVKPKVITITNIYRDQLDRFGEVDSTQKLITQGIKNALQNNSSKIKLVLNADDKKVLEIKDLLSKEQNIESFLFKVRYSKDALGYNEQEIKNLEQDAIEDIEVDLLCEILEEYANYSKLRFSSKQFTFELELDLPGLYNVYNATAAVAAAMSNNIDADSIKAGVEAYKTVFGRSEKRQYHGIDYQVFLIKNPTGCSEVLKHLAKEPQAKFMIAINDNYADGRDVSWLWDADFELLGHSLEKNPQKEFFCSGHRANDMAVRLKYAGIPATNIKVETDFKKALDIFVHSKSNEEELYLLPTYTALLELEK